MLRLGEGIVSELGENILLYQLAFARSSDSLLQRIPSDWGGVYAWYRHFSITKDLSNDPSLFFEFMVSELTKDHCVPRSSKILPAYKVCLSSDNSNFPKLKLLEKLSKERNFRESILEILEKSILFQHPFYVGKANNFKVRIRSHLNLDSPLRTRLNQAGHDLGKAKLLLIRDKECDKSEVSYHTDNDDLSDDFESADILDDTSSLEDKELELIEDILSRLFLPSFTVRYG